VRAIKLCANGDVALANARCSFLTELQMGNLHEKVPGYAQDMSRKKDMSRKNSLRAVKFVIDHKWTGNPDRGLHYLLSGSRQAKNSRPRVFSARELLVRRDVDFID
jgi:hypothetical protein